jgi:hypothetical protein
VFDLRRQLHEASLGLPPGMNVHHNLPSSGVTRQAAQRCTRYARLREARGPDATKRATRGWARWDKTVQLASLTSSYSSLQGADRYSGERVIQGPHGGVTFAGFLLTKLSQFHPVSTRMSYPIEGRSTHEGKVAVSRSASLPGGVNQAWRGGSSGARRQRKKASRLPSRSCSSLAPFCLCSSLLCPREGLLVLWFLAPGSGETQKTISS